MSHWRVLLDRIVTGLDRFRANGLPITWVLSGGTALMVHTGHRISKDIDAVVDDPQYLSVLSPRLDGETVWRCDAYEEASNHLRLIYPEGEIDFIVATSITDLAPQRLTIGMEDIRPGISHHVAVDHPVEIALKKLNYRGALLKVRDMFDIAVVDSRFPELLKDNLHRTAHLKIAIAERLSQVADEFARQELDELAIADEWRPIADTCLARMRRIAGTIPAAMS